MKSAHKCKSLRASDGAELMTRFAKNQPVLHMAAGGERRTLTQDLLSVYNPIANGLGSAFDSVSTGVGNAYNRSRWTGGANTPRRGYVPNVQTPDIQPPTPSVPSYQPLGSDMGIAHSPDLRAGIGSREEFLAANPGVAANQKLSPSAPVSPPPAPAPAISQPTQPKQNSFGNIDPLYTSATPAPSKTSLQDWSAPGRSNGRPDEQTMQAGNALAASHATRDYAAGGMPQVGIPPTGAPAPSKSSTFQSTMNMASTGMAGMRTGGDLRTGMGGDVPGTGAGDKIPAKYEPGEFVVSNDMLKAEPELRDHLRGLRAEVLAEKGMTPEMADAKALKGGGLRAVDAAELVPVGPGRSVPPTAYTPGYRPDFVTPTGGAPAAAAPAATAPKTPYWGEAPKYAGSTAYDGGKYLGDRARLLLNSPGGQTLGNVASAALAIPQGMKAATAYDQGDYAGALNHGIRAGVAMAPAAFSIPVGAGIMAGDKVYENMSQDTKDSIGRNLNAGVRNVGKAFGQDWGVDDSAMRKLQGVPLSYGVNADAPKPAAKPMDEDAARIKNNQAIMDKANVDEAAAKVPVKLGDIRNFDPGSGTMEMFTKGNGNVAGWTTVSTPERKAKDEANREKWEAREAQRADAMQERQAMAGMPLGLRTEYALHKADVKQRQDAAELQANTTLMSNRATNMLGMYNAKREQNNWERDFDQKKSQQQFQQREESDKNLTSKLEAFHTTKDTDGKTVVNKDAVAASRAAVTAHLDSLIRAARARGDEDAVKELRAKGVSAMGEDGLQRLLSQLEVRQRSAGAHGTWNPFSGTHIDSNKPEDYDITGVEQGVLQDQYKLRGGGRVPVRAIDYTGGGNAILPNSVGDTRTTRFDNIKSIRSNQ